MSLDAGDRKTRNLVIGDFDGTGERGGLGGVVTVLEPPEAKGLEFDAVVVVEPSTFFEDASGGRLLYIAMTRAVQALALLYALPLPESLVE